MCSKQIRVLCAVCGHDYGQLANIFVHFQSQKYVEKAIGRATKLTVEYRVFVHMLQNDMTWKK